MTREEIHLEAIEKRYEEFEEKLNDPSFPRFPKVAAARSASDVPALLTEIKRLRSMLNRANTDVQDPA